MRISGVFLFIFFVNFSIAFAQDDETRRATGLPMEAGRNAVNSEKGTLSGKITLAGLDPSQSKPTIFVSVYLSGLLVDKRQVSDTGNYFIPEAPRNNGVLVVEVNGVEVGRQPLPSSVMSSMRQDLTINLAEAQNSNKFGVISAKNLYKRSQENEKLFEKAISAAKEKNTENAVNLFKQLVNSDTKDFVAWTELATLYFRNEKFTESEQTYIKALEQNIEFMPALVNLGKLYINQKQPAKAILILSKAVEVEPTSADSQHLLGEAYLLDKKGSKAVVYLNEAIRLAPLEKAEIHLRLASLYNAAGLKDKAIEEYKQFLQKVPNHSDKEKIEKYIKDNSPK